MDSLLARIGGWWFGRLFGPKNRWLFNLRLSVRIMLLRLRLWWSQFHFWPFFKALPRPLALLLVGLGLPALVLWWLELSNPGTSDNLAKAVGTLINGKSAKAIQWREATQLLIIFIGLPAAFVLWAFRDHHVNGTLANQRKDVNLKEFQEIQLRAAGALDEKLPAEAREQLQIAALHQLRGFLRGDFGPDFCRPAFELLLAGHTAAMARIGLGEAIAKCRDGDPDPANIRGEIESAISEARSRWTAVDRERAGIVRDEWQAVFRRDWPLNGRRFDGIRLPAGALLARLQLDDGLFIGADLHRAHLEGAGLFGAHLEGAGLIMAHLEGAHLSEAHLEGADLSWAHLEGADLRRAHLEGADLRRAHLEGAGLFGAHLEGADLSEAHLEGAGLREANLEGADLTRAHLEGANLHHVNPASIRTCKDARYDDRTIFVDPDWRNKGDPTADEVREQWRAKGARHVDE